MTWRSLLYVPASQARFLDKAQTRGADALVLDLEDSVPEPGKDAARAALVERWEALARGPSSLVVRINGELRHAAADIGAVIRPGLAALMVPKVRGVSALAWLAEAVAHLEAERGLPNGSVGLIPLLETPDAVEAAFAIARTPRVVAMALGGEDLAAACGMTPDPAHLAPARSRLVAACAAAGVPALGLLDTAARIDVSADLVRASRSFGFRGSTTVHPAAIGVLNAGFCPDDDEVRWAKSILEAASVAEASGRGAIRLDGRMIDRPVLLRAQGILAARQRL